MLEHLTDAQLKEYIDTEDGLGRVRGNQGLFQRMLGLFLQSPEFEKLEHAIAAKDFGLASDTAHAVKGLTGNLGMHKLFDLSNRLMLELRAGAYDEELYRQFLEVYETTAAYAKKLTA